ncbi:hypothetical protein EYV94_00825 [Puteibacter caeruleilacunae]|nr:hypothetical protein EYV94_00825 [Puteibacter caeruleilacunae]
MKPCFYMLLLLLSLQVGAQELKLNGFADSYHAVRSSGDNDFMSSRSRLRTELSLTKGNSYLFASLNSVHNNILNDETKIELREAFLQYTANNWDIKIGRQIIIWGVTDAMRITDQISPMDYTEFLARDYDDIRVPVNAARIKLVKRKYTWEFVLVPVPEFFIIPVSSDNPWSAFYNATQKIVLDEQTKPKTTLKNTELGCRFSFFLSGIDFSFSALHSWNKMPIFKQQYSPERDTIFLSPLHKRMEMFGCDFSAPISEFVIRGEMASFINELQEDRSRKNSVHYLLGADWYPGNDWTATIQYSHKHINGLSLNKRSTSTKIKGLQAAAIPGILADNVNYSNGDLDDSTSAPKNIHSNSKLMTFGITKKLIRSLLLLSTFTYYDLNNHGLFNRNYADYSISDQIHLIAGYDWFEASEGMFATYKHNSEYWIKAKFCF